LSILSHASDYFNPQNKNFEYPLGEWNRLFAALQTLCAAVPSSQDKEKQFFNRRKIKKLLDVLLPKRHANVNEIIACLIAESHNANVKML